MVKTVVSGEEIVQGPKWPQATPVTDFRWMLYEDLELAGCEVMVDAAETAWVKADQAVYEARSFLGEEQRVEEEALADLTAEFGDLPKEERDAICTGKSAGERAKQLDTWVVTNVEWPVGVRVAIRDAKGAVRKAEHGLEKAEHALKRVNSRLNARLRRLDFIRSLKPIAMVNAAKVPEVAARVTADEASATDAWVETMLGTAASSPLAQLALKVLPEGVDPTDQRVKTILDQIRGFNAQAKTKALASL